MQDKGKTQYLTYLKKVFLPLAGMGLGVGVCAGAIVGIYNYLAEILVDKSIILYDKVKNDMRWLPLAIGCEIVIGLIIGFLIQKFPEIRGSGIPYIESVARGNLKLTWPTSLPLMFITSLLSLFSGMGLGSEGPSVYMGGCVGYAFGKLIHISDIHDMLLVSAGSASGLSVAFNSPLAGLIFSLEEVYRKFSTQIILSSVVAVSIAQIILHLIFEPHMLDIGVLEKEVFDIKTFGIALITGIIGGLFGALFNFVIRKSPLIYKKMSCLRMMFYVIFPTVLASILCLWWPDASYGGSRVMKKVILNQMDMWEVIVSFLIKFFFTCFCFGSKATGGIFIPMLSVGALLGGVVGKICLYAGMKESMYSYVVIMCVSSFFTGVVRAPLTSVILPVEYTGCFTGWCGPITAVAFAYMAAEATKVEPLYEALMENIVEKNDDEDEQGTFKFSFTVSLESMVCGLTVREVILPDETVISRIIRDDVPMIPKEDTQIIEDDEIIFKSETTNPDYVEEQLSMLF